MKTLLVFALFMTLAACQKEDPGTAAAPTNPPNAPKQPKAKTPVKPATVEPQAVAIECEGMEPLPASAREVLIEDIIDGQEGEFRVVRSQLQIAAESQKEKRQMRAMVTAEFSPNANLDTPDYKATITCRSMKDAPEGSLNGHLITPLALSRKDGVFTGRLRSDFVTFGVKANATDSLSSSYSPTPEYKTVWSFKTALQKVGEGHIYAIDGNQFEIRFRQIADNGELHYTVTGRMLFVRTK